MVKFDIEMPKNCFVCKFGGYFKHHYFECFLGANYTASTRRPKGCPLIPIYEDGCEAKVAHEEGAKVAHEETETEEKNV